MNTPTEPPDSPSKPKRHPHLVPPLSADEAVPEPEYKTPRSVILMAAAFGTAVVTAQMTVPLQVLYRHHAEVVAHKDVLAEMYPDPKDLCVARIISMTKQIRSETGGVLPPDLLVVANANGVRCEHDEKKGKYSLKFTP